MGQSGSSTGSYGSFLDGASWPPPPDVTVPPPPRSCYQVEIPKPKEGRRPLRPGEVFAARLAERRKVSVRVPQGSVPGQMVQVVVPELAQMVASTLHSAPPGCRIVSLRPIVVANVSYQIQGPTKEQASSQQVASMMQAAQQELCRQAHGAGCNAVLGIGFSTTTTSSTLPGQGVVTLAMVSGYGTPVIIIREGGRFDVPPGTSLPDETVAPAASAEDNNLAQAEAVQSELAPDMPSAEIVEEAAAPVSPSEAATAAETVEAEVTSKEAPKEDAAKEKPAEAAKAEEKPKEEKEASKEKEEKTKD